MLSGRPQWLCLSDIQIYQLKMVARMGLPQLNAAEDAARQPMQRLPDMAVGYFRCGCRIPKHSKLEMHKHVGRWGSS
jgi:hypothetical protein